MPDTVLVPRNIAVKETGKIPTLTDLVLLVKGEIYIAKSKEKKRSRIVYIVNANFFFLPLNNLEEYSQNNMVIPQGQIVKR